MINHVIEYVKLFHPLKREKSIAVSDPDGLAGTLSQIRADDRKSDGPAKVARFLRVLITADNRKQEGKTLVKNFESQSQKIHEYQFNWLKLKIFLCLTVTECIGYFLYWCLYNFRIVWFPSVWFINTFFGGSMGWWLFFGAIIILLPVSFLIANFFGGKRWNRIHWASKYTELFSEMGKDRREEIKKKYIKISFEILAGIAKQEKVDVSRIRLLVDKILLTTDIKTDFAKGWAEEFDEVLEDLSCNLSDSLRGEITKLQDIKEDLLSFYWQGFRFAPLIVVNPSSEIPELAETDVNLNILFEGFKNKAKNLKAFLEEVKPLQEEIWTNLELLEGARGKSERVEILERLQDGFERVRNIASGFHFGDNPNIPHQRGRNISDLYDKLYELVGRTKNDIREGKRQARALIFSKLPVKTEAQQKRRISQLMLKIERVLGQKIEHSKTYDRMSHSFAWWGKGLARGVALSLILFFCFTSILSFKVLGPDQVLATRPLAVGVKEKVTQKERILSRGLKLSYPEQGVPVGFGKRLFWHLPIPLTWSHAVELNKPQTFTGFRTLTQLGPRTLWQKGMSLLAGAYGGRYFEVLFIDFEFKVKDKDVWAQLDFDGQGPDRLTRDITPIIDKWQDNLFNFYEDSFLIDIKDVKEREKIFAGDFLEKLSRDGTLKQIIQGQLNQMLLYGYEYRSILQRLSPGLDAVENDLERREHKIKMDMVEVEDKERALKEIGESKKRLMELRDEIEKASEKEYATLRKQPELLKRVMENPKENIEELKGFEMVWLGIQQTIMHQYAMDKFKKMLGGELGQRKKEELIAKLNKKIAEDGYFSSLIEIKDIRAEVHFMNSQKYQQRVQMKMMELAELT